MYIIGIGWNPVIHSSFMKYLAFISSFYYKSLNAIKSSGSADGTLAIIPVPFYIDIFSAGNI